MLWIWCFNILWKKNCIHTDTDGPNIQLYTWNFYFCISNVHFEELLLKDHSLLVLRGWKELIELGPSGIIHYLLIFSFYLLLIFFVYMYFSSLVFLCGAATSTILFLSFSLLYIPSIIMLFKALPYQSVARSGNWISEAFSWFIQEASFFFLNLFCTRVPAHFGTV